MSLALIAVALAGCTSASLANSPITAPTFHLTFSPSPLTFPDTPVGGTSAFQTITVTNTGTGTVTIGVIGLAGANPGDFNPSPPNLFGTCQSGVIAPGSSCGFPFSFSPTAGGLRTATFSVSSNAIGSPQTITLTGKGLQGVLQITPSPLTFPATLVGGTSPQQTLTLINTGNARVTFGGFQLTNIGEFHLPSGPCTVPALLPGSSCQIFFTFTPQAQGLQTATFTMNSDGFGSPQSVTLTGNGIAPALAGPATRTFPDTPVGGTSPVQTVTFHNGGTAPENTTGTTLTGANPSDFQIVNNACFPAPPLAPGSDCTVSLTFSPAAAVARNAVLTVIGDSSAVTTLSGNGLGPAKAVTLTPNPVSFQPTAVGVQSPTQILAVTNSGSLPVNISARAPLSGPNAGDFSVVSSVNDCLSFASILIGPGGSCTVAFTFTPTVLGARSAIFTLTFMFGSDPTVNSQTAMLTGNGIAPTKILTLVSPNPFIFPDVIVGGASQQPLELKNVGNTQVSFTTTLGGPNAGDFFAPAACGPSPPQVGPGVSCFVFIDFKPSASGLRTVTLTITSDASNSPLTVTLRGNGLQGVLTITPSPLIFPDTPVGGSSPAQALTVSNTGSATVNIKGFGSTDASEFPVTKLSGCSQVAPGSSCVMSLIFNPQAVGLRTATFTLSSDAVGNPQTVTLTGNGLPDLSLTPNPLNFPDTPVGRLSPPQTLTVTNIGPALVRFNAISLGGANASEFQITTNQCMTTTSGALSASASCAIGFTFNPQAAGARTATLTVASDGAGSPQMVTLNGNGIAGQLSLTPSPLSFPPTPVGRLSAAQTLTVTNTGPATVRFNAISLSGVNASDFQIAGNQCQTPTSGALSANASCTIDFTFNPQGAGARTAILTIISDATGSPQTVTLSGNGVAGQLTLTPNPLNFPDTAVGSQSASLTLTVTNTGPATVRFSAISIGGTNAGDFQITTNQCQTPTSGALSANASCTLSFTFNPQDAGARTATLTIASDATGSPQTETLTGNGVAPVIPRFAYQANPDGTVSIFTFNPATGRLQSRGYATVPLTGTASATALALDPQNRFVFYGVANSVLPSSSVFTFTIDSATGALTLQPGPLTTSGNVSAVVVDPSGRFLYVGGGSASAGQVAAFSINSTTGALTQITGSPFTAGTMPRIAVDPAGKFLYSGDSFGVSAFTIDPTTGALTPVAGSPFAVGGLPQPEAIAVDPKGKFVYFLSNGSVSAFAINGTSGVLTPVPGSPFAPSAPNLVSVSLAIDPTSTFIYVTNNSQVTGTSSISAYKLDAITGALTPIAGSPFSAGTAEPFWVSVDPSGAFLYVPSFDTTAGGIIQAFSIAPGTGVLTSLGTTLARLFPHAPVQLAISTGTVPVISKPQYVLVPNSGSNDVSAYAISPASGALTAVSGSPFLAGTSPVSVSTDLLGRFAYVANSGSNDISAFGISPTTATLTPVTGSPFTAGGTGLQSVVVDLSSEFVYAANSVSQNISEFSLNPATGALAAISGSPLGTSFSVTALSDNPTGQQIFAVGAGIGNFTMGNFYDVTVNGNPSATNPNGALSVANTLSTGTELKASSVAVHPSGRFAYVTNMGSNHVTGLSLTCCQTVPVPGSPFPTGTGPTGVAIEPLGRFLYVANSGSNNISAYSIDPATGTASPLAGSPFPAGANPSALAVDGSGKFLLVTNKGDNTVSVFTIDSNTGALTVVTGSPFVTGTAPVAITVINMLQ